MKINFVNKLSTKLVVIVSIVVLTVLSIYTYINIGYLRDYLTRDRFQNASNISDLIKKSTRYSMLLNRRDDVHQIISTVGTETGVKGIRIYNKSGTIIFSTDSTEVNKTVNVTAEACIKCHNGRTSLKTLSATDKIRIFKDKNNKPILGLINPIQNEKDCYTADCHAHDKNMSMLGVLDVMISLEGLDAVIADNTRQTIYNSLFLLLAISLASGIFISVLVNRPIKKLVKGMDALGEGNLNYQIKVKSKDELGIVAGRFNDMAVKLDSAYTEIKEWSETLNKKVTQKTEELKNIYGQVVQIEKLASLGKLSATVAHELNNPLEGILTYSKLISKKLKKLDNTEDYTKIIGFLDLISDESARCGKIVKDLLLFSHRGEDDEFSKESLKEIIDKSITLINHHLQINGVELIKEYPENEICVTSSSQKIQQALMSLLINAIESMPHGGKIIVKLIKENSSAVIRIVDEGTGISEKDRPHIFEPFYSTKEAGKGTGLGLAVAYGIINNHNGNIEVEQTSPKGTTFKITLPLNEKQVS